MEYKELMLLEMGWRIRLRREELGMTRESFAEALDVSTKFVSDLECGIKGISVKKLYRLSQVLNVSVEYLFTGKTVSQTEKEERKEVTNRILDLLKECTIEELRNFEDLSRVYGKSVGSK